MNGVIERQAILEPNVAEAISNMIGHALIPLDRKLTLEQQAVFSGESAANLRRLWKFNPDYRDVIWKEGKNCYTTIGHIRRCRDRAAKRASIKPG